MRKVLFLAVLSVSVIVSSCTNKKEKSSDESATPAVKQTESMTEETATPAEFLNVTASVKGDEVNRHEFSVAADGTYTVTMQSDNIGSMFVVQDAEGNDVAPESGESWTGELKAGNYVAIAGLTRNAARKDCAAANYTLMVK